MLRQALLTPLLLALPLVASRPAQPQLSSRSRVEVVSGGMKLTLTVPKRVYPQDAVIRTTVTVRSISSSPLLLFHQFCGRRHVDENPRVIVQPLPGQTITYPKALLGPQYHCPPPPPPGQPPAAIAALPRLLPGQVLQRRTDVILLGGRLQAEADLVGQTDTDAYPEAGARLLTPPITVKLIAGVPPRVDLHPLGATPYADVHPTGRVHGKPFSIDWSGCASPGYTSLPGGVVWLGTPHGAVRISPRCAPLTEWHAVVGWLAHSVATIDYVKAQRTPWSRLRPGGDSADG